MREIGFPAEGEELLRRYGIKKEQVSPVQFNKGESVLEQGFPVRALYFIVSGSARIQTYSADGKMLSFGTAGSGSALGDMELLMGLENSCNTVMALTKLVCLALPYTSAARLAKTNPALSYQLGHNAALLWWYRNNNYVSAFTMDAQTRLCAYLLENAPDGVIRIPLTEINFAVSTSYRHLLRLIRSLVEEGILAKEGRNYRILNAAELERRATV